MKELSLFSGAGGGLLGTKLLGWEHCGYVEFNDYCQRVIAQRIDDGFLDEAPIFSDIKAFISDGYADAYKGMVDVVTGGFPCQPFSVAGKQAGADDSRNLWPETLAVLRIVQPRFAYLENVPGLLTHEYARRIFGDLAESGFDARWRVLSVAEVGAPHKRDRVWIVAHSNDANRRGGAERRASGNREPKLHGENGSAIPNSINSGRRREIQQEPELRRGEPANTGRDGKTQLVADSAAIRPQRTADQNPTHNRPGSGRKSELVLCDNERGRWWETEPDMGRVVDGVAARVDRLKALGNGQVPAVAATAWEALKVSGVK